MKKQLFLSLLAALTLVGCGSTSSSSSSSESSLPSSESSSAEPVKGDANWVDYAKDGEVKLALDYNGHTFYEDGVEQVELLHTIDGDTAHFTPKSGKGDTIKSRFYGIDTPESTGKVQEYGKEASNYTAEILTKAASSGTIVVSSAQEGYGLPQPDSTGSRYVSLIWVNLEKKDAPLSELYCLNLMIVQEGFSWVKNLGSMPTYEDTFYKAESQAKTYKLNLHSGKPAGLFNYGDYEDVSLLDLKKEIVANLSDPDHKNKYDNVKVRVQGTVSGFANHILYISDFFPEYDENGDQVFDEKGNPVGEYAGVNIFCGMQAVLSKFTKVGTYIQLCGLALYSDSYGFQITDVSLPTIAYDENDGKVLLTPSANTEEHALHVFEYTTAELNKVVQDKNYESLYCAVKVTDPVHVGRAFKASSGMYVYFDGGDFDTFYVFNYQPHPETDPNAYWDTADKIEGHDYYVSGVLGTHVNSNGVLKIQILLRNSADLVLIEEE